VVSIFTRNAGVSQDFSAITEGGTHGYFAQTLQYVIESRVTPGDTIVPMYYANASTGEHWGGEAVLKTRLGAHVQWELSYSLFRGLINRPFDVEHVVGGGKGSDQPKVPEHTVRSRLYFDFWNHTHFTVNAMWNSVYSLGEPYNFVTLQTDQAEGTNADEPGPRFRLDFKVEKGLMDDLLSFYVWGNDVFSDGRVDYYNQLTFLYHPKQVQRSFGVGLILRKF
jgi:hypothetical protein